MEENSTGHEKEMETTFNQEPSVHHPLINQPKRKLVFRFRYLITLTACFGIMITNAMSVCLGQAIVAMVNKTTNEAHENHSECTFTGNQRAQTTSRQNAEFSWDGHDQGILLSSIYWGAIISPVPASWLANKFGGKIIFQIGIGLAGVCTIFLPPIAHFSFYLLLILRIITGLSTGAVTPAMTTILANWTPLPEKNFHFIVALFGGQISNIIAYPLTGYLCENGFSGGWPSVFYLFGGIGIFFAICCTFLISESPAKHGWISEEERLFIETNRLFDQHHMQQTIPWKKIYTSVPVWALMISNVFFAWGYFLMLTEIPTYIADILHFPLEDNSMFMAVPFVLSMVISVISSLVADWIFKRKYLSVTVLRKVAVCMGHISAGVLVLLVPSMGCNRTGALALLITMMGITAFNSVGTEMNFSDLMPQFAGTMYAVVTVPPQLAGIVSPYLVGLIIQHQSTMEQWNKIFYITSASYITGVVIFVSFATGKQQTWDTD